VLNRATEDRNGRTGRNWFQTDALAKLEESAIPMVYQKKKKKEKKRKNLDEATESCAHWECLHAQPPKNVYAMEHRNVSGNRTHNFIGGFCKASVPEGLRINSSKSF
jgi:hypothetical protein